MTIEGSYIYSCPIPDERGLNKPKGPAITMYPDQDYVQGLINTVAMQREEIEVLTQQVDAYKQVIALMKKFMTEEQLLALSVMAEVLTKEKK